jgi:hypothetical protein
MIWLTDIWSKNNLPDRHLINTLFGQQTFYQTSNWSTDIWPKKNIFVNRDLAKNILANRHFIKNYLAKWHLIKKYWLTDFDQRSNWSTNI